jgi:SAM-dependent methyltransferase
MSHEVYESPDEALAATDEFYRSASGFQYSEEGVTEWLRSHVEVPGSGKVLDLCCGDGIWAKGLRNVNPTLEVCGIDISSGGVEQARSLLEASTEEFVVGDAECRDQIPWDDGTFALIFARGPGLFNQHDLSTQTVRQIINEWHNLLTPEGRFYSVFASRPELMGSYTAPEEVKLPYNRAPRHTSSVRFRGGKFHHTIHSLLEPFWRLSDVCIEKYSFFENKHVLVTSRADHNC